MRRESGRSHFSTALRWAGVVAALLLVALALQVAIVLLGGTEADSSNATQQVNHGQEAKEPAPASATLVGVDVPNAVSTQLAEQVSNEPEAYELNPLDLLAIGDSDEVASIVLASNLQPAGLSQRHFRPVQAAVDNIEERGPCSFVFADVETGRGVAYRTGEVSYIASSSKAVLAYYAVAQGGRDSSYVASNIETAIVDSSNKAFERFGYEYNGEDYAEWLAAHDVEWPAYEGDLFVQMNARSLASIWAEILQFLQGGSDDARWFADLLGTTNRSFIRDALEPQGAVVLDKAGWIADWEYDSTTDAGVVLSGGRAYLMVIVTGQPDSEQAEANVGNLAAALFDLRADL